MGVLGAVYWLRYGLMKMDYTMIAVNVFAATLMSLYLIFYYFMTKKKKVVLRQRSCETLPLPMCIANLFVSSQWALYGLLVSDVYIITPNAIGMLLAMIQIGLFLIFPMKQGRLSPVQRCFNPSCCAMAASSFSSEENGSHFESKLLWCLNSYALL
uniref:Sugar transporter SWEET1 n=1 Tax=Loa loa TaxID=7209 RepID=A0A1I7W0S6_LOALO